MARLGRQVFLPVLTQARRFTDMRRPDTLVEIAQAVATRRQSVTTTVEAAIRAMETDGVALNCVARLDRPRALAAAAALDREDAAPGTTSPVHGVPMAHKDMFDRAGHASTWGSARIARPAGSTAALLNRLDALGAIDIGSLHMTEFALDSIGANDHFGPCVNPLTPDRIAGGSSSGLAAAVSDGLIPTGLGSDTGGSIRIPSAFCGVFGLKPTNGALDMKGVMPLAPTLDCVGPIARTATDIAVMMSVLADCGEYGLSGPGRWLELDRIPDGKLRIGFLGGYFSELNSEAVDVALVRTAARLSGLGFRIGHTDFADIEPCIADVVTVARAESTRSHGRMLSAASASIGDWTAQRLRAGLEIEDSDYRRALERRPGWIAHFLDRVFEDFDFLACATVPVLAPFVSEIESDAARRNETVAVIGRNTRLFNYLGLPALSVPIGGRLGIGMQLVGRPYSEPALLSVAHRLFAS